MPFQDLKSGGTIVIIDNYMISLHNLGFFIIHKCTHHLVAYWISMGIKNRSLMAFISPMHGTKKNKIKVKSS